MGAAMREAGYSKHTANRPSDVTNSVAWQNLMDKYIPDEYIAAKHAELAEATIFKSLVIPYSEDKVPVEEEIRKLIEIAPGTTYLGHSVISTLVQKNLRIEYLVPDYRSRKDAIDLAYKVRGKYSSAKKQPITERPFSLAALRRLSEGGAKEVAEVSGIDK